MADIIMEIGVYIFAILFLFLIFVFIAAVASLFTRKKYEQYEQYVSVVIPCYNGEKTIARCLNSVLSLDYPPKKMEIIVVDDGSTDSTPKILGFRKRYRNLVVVRGRHEGKSYCLNIGMRKSLYPIIFTVDADTFVEKNSLKRLVMPFSDNRIGATNGSCIADNTDSMISIFQRIEYHYNNLIRKSFSNLFNNGILF